MRRVDRSPPIQTASDLRPNEQRGNMQERALPSPIGTHDRHDLAGADSKLWQVKDYARPIADGDSTEP